MGDWLNKLSKIRSRQNLYEFLEKEYKQIKPGQSVLTIGAGGEINKDLYKYGEEKNFDILSFDIDEDRGPDVVGDICTYDFKEKRFDVIIMSEVLQFLQTPQIGIDNVYKILKPGGRLILTSPFVFPLHDRPYDLYRFTKHGLKYLLFGFDEVTIEDRNGPLEAIDVLWLRLNKFKGKHSYSLKRIIVFTVFYLKRPLTLFLQRYIKTDIMTTGYNVVAIKKS